MKPKIAFHDRKMEIPFKTGFFVRIDKDYDELMYVIYELPYCWLHFCDSEKFNVEVSLQIMSASLPAGVFFQCNRSTIVNLYRCQEYDKEMAVIVMEDGSKHHLSRRRAKDFFCAIYHRPPL